MRILALDLGTKTGWAYGRAEDGVIEGFGTLLLANEKALKEAKKARLDRRLDIRIPRLLGLLTEIHHRAPLDWVMFEDVQFASTTMQAHLWASFRGTVWTFVSQHWPMCSDCLATGKLKVFATGSGNADKPAMERALRRDPRFFSEKMDDNAVDAIHLLKWSQQILKRA